MTEIRVILVHTGDKLLEQIDEDLGKFALQKLKDKGVEFILNTHVVGATALLHNSLIPSYFIYQSTSS
jgi:NADH:ubiquinone reductase (H+-translocating)